jgi:hypothetical protein
MLTKRSQLNTMHDALRVLIADGDPDTIGRVQEAISKLVRHESALRGKADVLNALRQAISSEPKVNAKSLTYADALLGFIAEQLREIGSPPEVGRE